MDFDLWRGCKYKGQIFWDDEKSRKLQQRKYNLDYTVDADRKQNCLNYNNDNLLILIIYKEMTAEFPKIFLLRILSINLSDIL